MPTFDLSDSGSKFPADGGAPETGGQPRACFHSVLYERPESRPRPDPEEPDCFRDLNLDQVLAALRAGRERYRLEPFFYAPLHEPDAVHYRHEVLRDLETPAVRGAIAAFAEGMDRMRGQLEQVQTLHYELQKQSWFTDAVETYCRAVLALTEELRTLELGSRALRGLRRYLAGYAVSPRFTELVEETRALKEALAAIRYAVRIQGQRATVTRYEGQGDYSAEVLETFARFRRGSVRSYLADLRDEPAMNHVEAQILDGVARLHPEPFAARAEYCARHRDFLEETIGRFDREVQFYLAYLELVERLKKAGLPFCHPQVSANSKTIAVDATFDIALANKLLAEERQVVGNDFYLEGPERMFVVSGPNNGGKTTFARTFGQLHHLAGLGLPVPGRHARLFLPDRIFTHFEREEDIETLRGKFDDELVRVHEILERASSRSVMVMNESFNSTTLNDALFVGTEVMRRILALGCLGVYVTFVEEIASLSEATVSLVTQIVPENPAERTFKVLRQPADGLAYASAIAAKYGLSYDRLMERIAP